MMRVVLDTNVLVAGFRSRDGASFRILELLEGAAELTPCVSVPLVLEYEAALRRLLGQDDWRIEPFLDYLCEIGEKREIFFLWRPFLRDAGDEMVLEVAVGAAVEAIVTHNVRDFDGVDEHFGIRVLTPGTLLQELEERK